MNPSTNTPEFIPFARPSIGQEEEQAVLQVLRSGWLTTAGQAQAFEQEFAELTGAHHALAVNSATAGLHLALEAVGVKAGDKVITTPYTFTATAEVIRYLQADPLFVDIDESSLTIDTSQTAAAAAHSEAAALLPVHMGGHPSDMNSLLKIAQENSIALVEDSAHALPVRYGDSFLGCLGDVGVFSFYATKTITTGEGGMVTTSNSEIADRIKVMRLHGIDREVWKRYTDRSTSWKYDVVAAGYKYNLPDVAAAIGRVQLKRAYEFLEKRRSIATRYLEAWAEYDFLQLPSAPDQHAWHLFILRIQPEKLTIDRDKYIELLQSKGIGTSVHYIPLHIMSYYAKRYGFSPEDFPVSMRVYRTAFSVPIYPDLSDIEVERIIEAVISIGTQYYRRSKSAK
ncbi:MAG TPA: DegT/DnrJ/EryC1/StrS aminotransferase family protein [Clostridia bacterium]|nr:DegT/DnrJ/EryC1/StrS aminotransferase family protein [Clostridia bacterium]